MSARKTSFPPVIDQQCVYLVLGSLPGEKSLAAQQYYAHPQNLFWSFIEAIFGIARSLPYEQRLQLLRQQHIALWDVVKHGMRAGSLDSAIRDETANDLTALLAAHPNIRKIGFNGQKAHQVFARALRQAEVKLAAQHELVVLPSTSPAHAAVSRAQKLQAWRTFFER